MTVRDFLEQDFFIGCSVMLECHTSKHGAVQVVFDPLDCNGYDRVDVAELENRRIVGISKFREKGTSGILLKLENVRITGDGFELYKVTSRCFSSGKVTARIEAVSLKEIPESSSRKTKNFDEYVEYFDTAVEAEKYREECYNA